MTKQTEVLVAPDEIHELLSRLTEYRVESLPVTEARTLAGLALNTGIPVTRLQAVLDEMRGTKRHRRRWSIAIPAVAVVTIFIFATALARKSPPAPAPAAVVETPNPPGADMSGLVPLTQVTYGPDNGAYVVDTSFEPSESLPRGIGLYASTGTVLWGSGDRLARAIHEPLGDAEVATLRKVATELLVKARYEATRRKLSTSKTPIADAFLSYPGPGFPTQLRTETFSGSSGVGLNLPPEGTAQADAKRIIKRSVDKMIEELQSNLSIQSASHSSFGKPTG